MQYHPDVIAMANELAGLMDLGEGQEREMNAHLLQTFLTIAYETGRNDAWTESVLLAKEKGWIK